MASNIQDELNSIFNLLAGSTEGTAAGSLAGLGAGESGGTTAAADTIVSGSPLAALETLTPVVAGLSGGVVGSAATSAAGGSTLESIGMDVLKSAFGLAPMVRGLLSLFGGGDSPAPPPLVKFAMPSRIDYQAAEVDGAMAGGDYGQTGVPRAYGDPAVSSAIPGITVNVQAMDARSFLDRSSDIAAAVKEAMLNLNSINDVVNDL